MKDQEGVVPLGGRRPIRRACWNNIMVDAWDVTA